MSEFATLTLDAPNGGKVALLGVSHTSAVYAPMVDAMIREIRPSAVVLEVDEVSALF
jgi:pheromone shutdown protein TraB